MVNITMGIIGEILFDIKDIEHDAEELSEALDVLLEMFILESAAIMPVPDWVPTPRNLRENKAMQTSRDYVMRLIKERRADGKDYGDVMSALLQAVDADNGETMTDEQVWAELMGLFIAGHETTAIMMTWALYALAKQPELQDKLYAEVSEVMQGDTPTLDDLEAMTFTDSVLKETLRHYPPAWSLFLRELVDDTEIGGHKLPKGAIIFISPWVMHHDPRHWDKPNVFDPSRFEGDWKSERPSYSYMPFGGGPRVCMGAHMAEMEAEVMLATMVKQFTFELSEPDQEPGFNPTLTLHPANGMPLRIRRRET
jgi:cytochrome P450